VYRSFAAGSLSKLTAPQCQPPAPFRRRRIISSLLGGQWEYTAAACLLARPRLRGISSG